MDENIEVLEKFTSILEEKQKEKIVASYPTSLYPNTWVSRRKNSFTAEDVISEVSKQVKAIQNADNVLSTKKAIHTNKYKQSTFLPVNMLSRAQVAPQPSTSKFNVDTQSVSDTQLLNVVNEAETLAGTTTGITQEFETTFYGKDEDETEDLSSCSGEPIIQNQNVCPILDITLKPPDPKLQQPPSIDFKTEVDSKNTEGLKGGSNYLDLHQNIAKCAENTRFPIKRDVSTTEHNINDMKVNIMNSHSINSDGEQLGHKLEELSKSTENENLNKQETLDTCMEIENFDTKDVPVIESDRPLPSSPVLTVKRKISAKKSNRSSPVVVDLKTFETFEEIAMSVVNKEADFETAKNLISSQISDKEELIRTYSNTKSNGSKDNNEPSECDILSQSILEETEDFLNIHGNVSDKDASADTYDKITESNNCLLDTVPKNSITIQTQTLNETEEENEDVVTITAILITDNFNNPSHINSINLHLNTSNDNENRKSESPERNPIKLSNNSESKVTDILKDEIIFSSDEEEYIYKSVQDLPLTAALETSFFDDQSDILDKTTMFVGFQTASNKSIQVQTDSFKRAKSLLDDFYEDNKGHSVSGLVDICTLKEKSLTAPATCFNLARIDERFHDNFENIKDKITKSIAFESESVSETCDESLITSKEPNGKICMLDSGSEQISLKTGSKYETEDVSQELFDESKENLSDYEDVNADLLSSQIISYSKPKGMVTNLCIIKTDDFQPCEYAHLPVIETKNSVINQCEITTAVKSEDDEYLAIDPNSTDSDHVCSQIIVPMKRNKRQSPISNEDIEEELPRSQIIRLSTSRSQKRKQAWSPISACKRSKTNSTKGTAAGKEIFEDVEFDTCDFEEIPMKDNNITENIDETDSRLAFIDEQPNTKTKPNEVDTNQNESSKLATADLTVKEVDDLHCPMFKTASDKYIEISYESLEKSEKFFKEITAEAKLFETISPSAKNINNEEFRTTSNRKKFSAESIETNTTNSEEPPFHGFLITEEEKKKVLKEIESCKKVFEELDFDRSIFELNKLEKEINCQNRAVTDDITNGEVLEVNDRFDNLENNNIECIEKGKSLCETKENVRFPNNTTSEANEAINNKNQQLPLQSQKTPRKPLKLSEEALVKIEYFFKDFDKACSKVNASQNFIDKRKNVAMFEPSMSASNEAVKTQAQGRTKRIFQNIDKDIDPEETEIETNVPDFKGFQTASNKPVHVSAKALAKSKKVFQDIDKIEDDLVSNSSENTHKSNKSHKSTINLNSMFQGFRTASMKPVRISPKSLARTKRIFENIDLDDEEQPTDTGSNHFANCQGFETGSNKKLEIPKEALTKRENIIHDINFDSKDSARDHKFHGFQTASNKQVKVSKEALAKSKKIFQDLDSKIPMKDLVSNISTNEQFQGFKTASNKEVQISEDALAMSKKIFEEIDPEIQTTKKPVTGNFQGFQTASNKEVTISEEALAKSKKLFQDIDSEILTDNLSDKMSTHKPFQGFKTASNKEVKLSEEALAKSKKIFQDIDSEIQTNKPVAGKFQGFQTASNKEVTISEEALAKSKKLFQDIDFKTPTNDLSMHISTNKLFQGFKTASNKEVKISEDALAKSKNILQEIDSEIIPNIPTTKKFQGFQTASNKQVKISEEALAKSKMMFQEIESEIQPNKAIAEMFQGFQTASNKKVSISEDALAKSKIIFKDIASSTTVPSNVESGDKVIGVISKPKSIDENLENFINSQVLNNFEQTLHSEDFFKDTLSKNVKNESNVTPNKSKRSGSPILSCPRSKKRKKFEIPYSQKVVEQNDHKMETNIETEKNEETAKVEVPGFKFGENYKKIKKYTLKDLAMLEAEDLNESKDTDPYLLNFNFDTLLDFQFINQRNDVDSTIMNIQDLTKKFEDSVNKKLIPKGWIDNHIKLILWKLISYEIKFPKTMSNVCTAKNVLEQLKYRYDKELYNAERPALRKILEKDDVTSKTLILCVVAIIVDGVPVVSPTALATTATLELLVTDGWYLVLAGTDRLLARQVAAGRVAKGTKLATSGAELSGPEQGVAPWEDTSSIRLKLSGNSTRRARWDARLGYHSSAAAILSRLTAVTPDGGRVARLRAIVARVYPALYVEKFEDGSTVTRSERLEQLYQTQHETDRQAILERLYEEVHKEMSDQDSEGSVEDQCSKGQMDSGSQIARDMYRSKDPAEYRHNLTSTQQHLLESYEQRKQENYLKRFQDCVQEKISKCGLSIVRNVVPLLKVRIAGVEEVKGTVEVTKAMLSVWKPNDAIREIVTEGAWIELLNVVPTGVRYSETLLSAGRQSIFLPSKYREPEELKPHVNSLRRTCHPLTELVRNPHTTTDYNEIDTVGFVFQIDPETKHFDANKQQFQNVYLADADKNIICINFWGGLKKFGFENLVETGQMIACTNLQKRAGNTRKNIPQYRATELTYFTKTPKNYAARMMLQELGNKMADIDKAKFCSDCCNMIRCFPARLQGNTENVSPYRFPNIDIDSTRNKIFIDSPLAQRSKTNTDENLNLTGLDFESTFQQADTQELSPKTLLRKRQVKEKLDKLKRYGEPPPLSPITILNKSKNAGSAFKSPLISKSECNQQCNIVTSPVLNKTYVKRTSVHPVKLNFSRNIDESANECVDHFAEDFEGSPPLSLD